MRRIAFLWMICALLLHGASLREKIAQMIMIGIDDQDLKPNAPFMRQLRDTGVGGVILFGKNIRSPEALRKLTTYLHVNAKRPLWIAVDQEGGAVQRLNAKNGFFDTPSAARIAKRPPKVARRLYDKMARMLQEAGIDLVLAPDLDLAIEPKNGVIVQMERSYGEDPRKVVAYAKILIDALEKRGIRACGKHFPGHGSSLQDSHRGFTDVSDSWREIELYPFASLIKSGKLSCVMTAHIYDVHLDSAYPATLSKKILRGILRKRLHFEGIILSDDLQMGAIGRNYTMEEATARAIGAGVDMLLFANQLAKPLRLKEAIGMIEKMVRNGEIDEKRIDVSYGRIMKIKGARE